MVVDLLIPVTAGVIGGFGSNYAWKKYNSPNLNIESGGEPSRAYSALLPEQSENNEQVEFLAHELKIENSGNMAAKNCRATIEFRSDFGLLDDQIKSRFSVSTSIPWAEMKFPSRTTINPGEVAKAVVLIEKLINNKQDSVYFPTDIGQNKTAMIEERGTDGAPQAPKLRDRLETRDFLETQWSTKEISVTAENAKIDTSTMRIHDYTNDTHREKEFLGVFVQD